MGENLTDNKWFSFLYIYLKKGEKSKMAIVVSTINLKGGVGKTHTTIALAEFLVVEEKKNVLVVDLDPQTNATIMLMKEKDWLKKNNQGETLNQLFKDALLGSENFDIDKAIVKNASNLKGGLEGLDLLPSSLDLIDIQDKLHNISSGDMYTSSPVTVLYEALEEKLDGYDFVFIDCPPNMGIITLNGLYFSDYYIIPCIPDILSTYGIPQIVKRVNKFSKPKNNMRGNVGNLDPLGIVVSKFRTQNPLHSSTIQTMESSPLYPDVFKTIIPEATDISRSAEFERKVNTLRQKYGNFYESYLDLMKEFLNNVYRK